MPSPRNQQSVPAHHAEWLRLVAADGPFLSVPVLTGAFGTGLDPHDSEHAGRLRIAHEEWEEAAGTAEDEALHRAWVKFVLEETLGHETLAEGPAIPADLAARPPAGGGAVLRPDLAVMTPDGKRAELLVCRFPRRQSLNATAKTGGWAASPKSRVEALLRGTGVRLGLATNGEHWCLVHVLPKGSQAAGAAGFVTWQAALWREEPVTLRAFRSLLEVRRLFGVDDDQTLPALLAESAEHQQEVTDQLGDQVRVAVEVLVQTFDRLDREAGGAVLEGVGEKDLYEAALTLMMRLVFLLCAEERGLLPLSEAAYADHYAAATLREKLRRAADEFGEEVLERGHDAYPRLLALARVVHGGAFEPLGVRAYGGTLFDPDRFPFLEGRPAGSSWRDTGGAPPAVDNRTVLHLLDALQSLSVPQPGRGTVRVDLSFRALDIEQIGHVYEGLLDHTAVRAAGAVLSLTGAKGKEPEVPLEELEALAEKGRADLLKFLKKATGRSPSALKNALDRGAGELDGADVRRFAAACGSDELWERVKPFADLVRTDTFGKPVVILPGSVYVTDGTDRRSSGTHYTPKTLTEPIVRHTLDPLVYAGPAEGTPEEDWELKPAAEILELKVCDMACGSGAFLVQAGRYLADKLLAAWEAAGTDEHAGDPLPTDPEELRAFALRTVAGQCLFGVDVNPLAAEMAKMSLWLLTLAKDRPFTFLGHVVRDGDSLAGVEGRTGHIKAGPPLPGISELDQLRYFDLDGRRKSPRLVLQFLPGEIEAAADLRRQIGELGSASIQQVRRQEQLQRDYLRKVNRLICAADFLISVELRGDSKTDREELHTAAAVEVAALYRDASPEEFRRAADEALAGASTFHWPLEFLDVYAGRGGFDAIVGNPPFMGGQKITGNYGAAYRDYLVERIADGKRGSADLCAYFFLRAHQLVRGGGHFGLVATNTVAQGDTREVGLHTLLSNGCVAYRATSSQPWPGQAALEVSHVWVRKSDTWNGRRVLDGETVSGINSHLVEPGTVVGDPHRLKANEGKSFQGSIVLGMGFVLEPEQAQALIEKEPKNRDVLFPYLNGQDLNSRPDQSPSRWVINFHDWPLNRTADGEWAGANATLRKAWLKKGVVPPDYPDPVAADYPDCLAIVERDVKPERQRLKPDGDFKLRKPLPQLWWIYGEKRPALYETISQLGSVFAIASTSQTLAFVPATSSQIFSHATYVLALNGGHLLSVLQCSLFKRWALRFGSSMKGDFRFVATDCFETFPFPPPDAEAEALDRIGGLYHAFRKQIMLARDEGLTKTYNRFHSEAVGSGTADVGRENWREVLDDFAPDAVDPASGEAIDALRTLHAVMDHAVAAAYGWSDLPLGHGFHATKQGDRFTLSEPARKEVLQRLLGLNHERYAQEVAAGLHDKGRKKGGRKKAGRKRKPAGAGLFDGDG